MAIIPEDITTIRVDQLANLGLTLESLFPHTVGTQLTSSPISDLVTLVANAIETTEALGFLPISVTDGQQLPDIPTTPGFFLAGAGTYLNVNGFPDLVCTENLNVIMTVDDHWEIAVQIEVNPLTGSVQSVTGSAVDNTDPLNPVINLPAGGVTSVNGDTGVVVVDLQSATDEGNTITDGTDTNTVSASGISVSDGINEGRIEKTLIQVIGAIGSSTLNENGLEVSDGTNVLGVSSVDVSLNDGVDESRYGNGNIIFNGVNYPLPTGVSSQIATLADITGGVTDGDKGDITVGSGGTVWTIDNGVVSNAKVASGIDAVKIGSGNVSNTEFGYLDGVTSAIQTQLNNRVGFHFKNTTQTVVTGTTSETIIYAEEVLANSISNNTILSFRSRNYRNPRVGTCIYKLYINTVNNLTGSPVQIGRLDVSANQGSNPFERDYLIKDNILSGFQFNAAVVTDLTTANVGQSTTTYNINTTYYWILTAQPNTSSDSLTHNFSILERI